MIIALSQETDLFSISLDSLLHNSLFVTIHKMSMCCYQSWTYQQNLVTLLEELVVCLFSITQRIFAAVVPLVTSSMSYIPTQSKFLKISFFRITEPKFDLLLGYEVFVTYRIVLHRSI